MAKGIINGGICGFSTIVEVHKINDRCVDIEISSNCSNIKKIAKELTKVDAFDELFSRILFTKTYRIASEIIPHPSCLVPAGILKTIEIEMDLSLPQEANIKVETS